MVGLQKRYQGESDSEVSPDSPNIASSHDPYKFSDVEIWETANKSKKNFKRGAKSIQGDIEVEGKVSLRGKGAAQNQSKLSQLTNVSSFNIPGSFGI